MKIILQFFLKARKRKIVQTSIGYGNDLILLPFQFSFVMISFALCCQIPTQCNVFGSWENFIKFSEKKWYNTREEEGLN